MQVEVVPETVPEDESVGAGRFGTGEEGPETGELLIGDGIADHLLDCNVSILKYEEDKRAWR